MSIQIDQAIIDSINETQRIKAIKDEGLRNINLIFPALNDIDEVKFQAEFWSSIAPAARQATVDFQYVIDVYTTAKQAISNDTLPDDVVWP